MEAERLAAHHLAQALRAAGYPVDEPGEPAPLPPLAPDPTRVAPDLALLVLEARRRPGERPRIIAGLAAWAARSLPPWEAEKAPLEPPSPPRPLRGLRGLLAALRAFARSPTLETARLLAVTAASEAWRPCNPRARPPRQRNPLPAAVAVIAGATLASLLLDPVKAALATIALAALAWLAAAAGGGAWAVLEYKWETCTASRPDLEAAARLP